MKRMIEVHNIDKGSKRILDIKKYSRLARRTGLKINIVWHTVDDKILLILPDGHSIPVIAFEGLSDETIINWIKTLYTIRKGA